jgi:DNA polymerase-4
MGSQHTLAVDARDRDQMARELLRLAARVAGRARAADKVGRVVAITVRFSDFTTVSRSRTLRESTNVTQDVYAAAVALLDVLLGQQGSGQRRRAVRLLGVRLERLQLARPELGRQLAFGERDPGWPEVDRAMDRAAGRFGSRAVRPASLL